MTATRTDHTPETLAVVAELLTAPTDSVNHRTAEFIGTHTAAECFDLVATVIDADAPQDTVQIRRLLPPLTAEVIG